MSLLNVNDLSVSFVTRNGTTQAVDQVSFAVDNNSITAIIGESGSGKSMTALALMQLLPDGSRTSGRASLDGIDLLDRPEAEMCTLRGNELGMIF